ncbi:MAG TPA: phosphatidylglycerophosphatase A [Nitrospinae bacterium]|nr:phosphatidylglycerophosphatase A [Nitrospinota bacterium]HBA25919.1 phosphatidylglycerophosphatase A [Nitrospinota bacterium]
MSNKLIKFIATGFYSGYSPIAPGTAGSLVGVLIYLLTFSLQLSAFSYFLLTISIVLIGIWVSEKAEYIFKRKDSQKIVIDEIAGILISLFMLPHEFWIVLSGFIIFRIIDISKPFYMLERLPNGFGVMMDDVAAGIATNLILQIFYFTICMS